MRTTIFTVVFVAFTFVTSFGQTKISGDHIQSYASTWTEVSYTPTSQPLGSLQSSTRILQLYEKDYLGGDGYAFVLIKENGTFKAYKYNAFGIVDKFEIKQLNKTGLPELILHTQTQNGNASYSESDEHYIVIDFDANQILWDLCSGYNYEYDNKVQECSQTLIFSDETIDVGTAKGNFCNPTSQDGTEYKRLPVGKYRYKNGFFYLPAASGVTTFQNFWADFQTAVSKNDKNKISEMTSAVFYDDDLNSYSNKTTFLNDYENIFGADERFMVKYAKIGQLLTAPKRSNEQNITYEPEAKIALKEVIDQSSLKIYRTKFQLEATAKVYELSYNYDRILKTASNPYQSVFSLFYFSQSGNEFKFCGKGLIN